MKSPSCEQYLEDPEAHAAHPESCAECRALFAELGDAPSARPIAVNVDALPVAAWEGAKHRPWPLVGGVTLAVLAMTFAFFLVAGESPVRGLVRAIASAIPQVGLLFDFFHLTGTAIPNAPTMWQVGIAISFLVVNTLLFLLLRRAPRGIDA
jgi:hypothetical protein